YTVFRGRSRVPGSQQDFGPLYLSIDEEHSLAFIDRGANALERFGAKERQVLNAMHSYPQFGLREAKQATMGEISPKTIGRAFRHGCEHGILTRVRNGIYAWSERSSGAETEAQIQLT